MRTEEEKDILREIGNIGGGHALTSLSMMIDQPLELDVPVCRVVNRDLAGSILSDPEALYAGISMTMAGTVDCVLALILDKGFTRMIIDVLDDAGPTFDVESLTDMQRSTLCEVGNIMGNSYINALGDLLETQIDVSVPHIVIDTGRRVLESFVDTHSLGSDSVLFVNSSFRSGDNKLESYMLMCPTDETLTNIFEKLGC